MNKKNLYLVLLIFVTLVTGLLLGNLLANRAKIRDTKNLQGLLSGLGGSKVDEIMSMIDSKYVDSVDINNISEELIVDMVAKLDPHSVYVPASELAEVNSQLEGSFSGIGVQFNIQNDTIMIVSVVSGGPSEKVGLQPGDRIVLVNDTTFTGKKVSNEKVMKKLRGKANTKVKLGIKRNGTKEILKYTVTRGKMPINSVDVAYMIRTGIGLIKVNKLGEKTYDEFLNSIASLHN